MGRRLSQGCDRSVWLRTTSGRLRAARRPKNSKRDTLKRHGTLNPHPGRGNRPPVRNVTQSATAFGIFTPYLLSSGSRLSARWPLRAIAREARTTARAQAHAGGSGLRRPSSRPLDLAAAIRERFAINARPRSIEPQVDVVGLDLTALIDTRQVVE